MSLVRALRAWAAPMSHFRRLHDGVRGVLALSPFRRGDLLLSVPISVVYFPHASPHARRLRRWNRATLFPEARDWLWRLSPDAADGRVGLSASASTAAGGVALLNVTPVEAALAVAVALRHFWRNDSRPRPDPALLPASRAADMYVRSLPLRDFLVHGLEAPYMAGVEDEASLHMCVEQVACNLRDGILLHATQAAYRVYDAYPSELDAALLAALYAIRARLVCARVVWGDRVSDGRTTVIAPLVDMLNHSAVDPTAAVCVSVPNREVVVRATRDIMKGEEITLHYDDPAIRSGSRKDDAWESRYLFASD